MVAEPFAHAKGKEVRRAEFSPDGRKLLTASFDGAVKLWDLVLLRPPPRADWRLIWPNHSRANASGAKMPCACAGRQLQRVQQRIAQSAVGTITARWAK
jgi:hypothetical protein